MMPAPLVIHVATTDMSLELLLGPQLSAFAGAGYRVAGASAPGPHVAALADRGIEHVPLGTRTRSMALSEDARALRELYSLFRRRRPTIVHTHNPKPGVYGRIAARIGGYTGDREHRPRSLRPSGGSARPAYGGLRVGAHCRRVLARGAGAERGRSGRPAPPAGAATTGSSCSATASTWSDSTRIDSPRTDAAWARRELGASAANDVVVGTVGRLVVEKGYRELFAAAGTLRRTRSASLSSGSTSPTRADAVTRTTRSTQPKSAGVRFLGGRDDVDRLYDGHGHLRAGLAPRRLPASAMEAAAMGVPIVATDIRGCRQVVDHGVTGLLVPPRRPCRARIRDRAARRRSAASSAACRSRRAAEPRRLFDQQRCIDTTLSAYERLLRRRGLEAPVATAR